MMWNRVLRWMIPAAALLCWAGTALAGGSCCEPNGDPGCSAGACEELICAQDPFCCDTEWDQLCADAANEQCPACGALGEGDCCQAQDTPGCGNADCQAEICAIDPFCCNVQWDSLCADAALANCPLCGGKGKNDCCQGSPTGTPGCNDAECEARVCAVDPFCCEVAWDSTCADEANAMCGICGGCCQPNGGLGCNDDACEAIVCAADAFCCDVAWDLTCANEAQDFCSVCGGGGFGACCFPNGACIDALTANDCAAQGGTYQGDKVTCAAVVCPVVKNDCCQASPNGTPGCNDPECQAIVCAADPFCCDVAWDGLCAEEAAKLCGICCKGDLDGDGDTDSTDLNILLSDFGTGDNGDLDGDDDTDSTDLNIMLGGFGCGA